MLYGRSEINEPSRFLRDVAVAQGMPLGMGGVVRGVPSRPNGFVESRRPGDRGSTFGSRSGERTGRSPWAPGKLPDQMPQPARRPEREGQFKPGDRVDHGLFGQGIVIKSDVTADDEEVTVAFAGKGTKTLLAGFAKLRKIAK